MDLDPVFVSFYVASLVSTLAILLSVYRYSRRSSTSLNPTRLFALTLEELGRLRSGDPVFFMHLSIAVGVGLSIAEFLISPVLGLLYPLRTVLLLASIPIVGGLAAAFSWRVQRYVGSKRVERDLLRTSSEFSAASTYLQLVLMAAILLTAGELTMAWFPALFYFGSILGLVRNGLVAIYYARPTVNLIGNFDTPLSSMRTPFKLGDVVSGKVDPSAVKIGVGKMSDFEGSQRLSFDSCVEIGACEAACPATAAGRPLSPRVLVRKLSLLSALKGEGLDDPFKVIEEEELWSCTSCGACVSSCPVSVKHLDMIYDLRRDLVGRGKLDKEKTAMLENLAQYQNPYGFKPATRADWANGLGIDTFSSNPQAEYLYWVGCVSSFDQRAQRVAKSLASILKHAGVSFAILASEEMCTGDPARRLGEEGRYQELAYQNIEKLDSHGVRKIIASCPHCFNAIKNEYPDFGGKYEVIYHTQLISDLIKAGRLLIPKERVQEVAVTLHDACYAARYNSVFEEPRVALNAAVNDVREMGRKKEKTFCCGAGGSNYWFKVPEQRSIAGIRTEEASKTGAKEIATECPFCLSMFEDSTKSMEVPLDVRDVAEIVAESLGLHET